MECQALFSLKNNNKKKYFKMLPVAVMNVGLAERVTETGRDKKRESKSVNVKHCLD